MNVISGSLVSIRLRILTTVPNAVSIKPGHQYTSFSWHFRYYTLALKFKTQLFVHPISICTK